jgi:hypothetical protein
MWRCSGDLTIDEVLQDPIIRAQMRADQVAAADLEALLRRLAGQSAGPAARLTTQPLPDRLAPDARTSCA